MTVRVYVPSTLAGLTALVDERRIAGPVSAHAVTPEVRAGWPEGDEEQWEYAALLAAASASAALAGGAGRRCVVAADVASVERGDADDPTEVVVPDDVTWEQVASAHVDLEEGADEDDELAWFAVQEIPDLR